jgi:SAM-dependent methyltransferase
MAHNHKRNFVEKVKKKLSSYFRNQFVLEVGNLGNEDTIKDLFQECSYNGDNENYNFPDETYDVVYSLKFFEYNEYWIDTFENMIRLCKSGGLVLFTCSQNFNEKIDFEKYFDYYDFEFNDETQETYFWGLKSLSDNSKIPIPVIGVPIVNGFHWIERLINSVDYPVEKLLIFNNNGRGELTHQLDKISKIRHPYIRQINVCHFPANIGVAATWNMTIKCAINAPYWIISNHDVAFTPGFLECMMKKSRDPEIGMVHGNEGAWDVFLLKDWVVQECGLFDENLYPAYVEDVDYYIRTMLSGIKRVNVNYPYLHGEVDYKTTGSQTWRVDPSLESKLHHSRILNELWYIGYKWGPEWHTGLDWVNTNPYKKPFNNENFPLSYTTFELNFVRQKYLGF